MERFHAPVAPLPSRQGRKVSVAPRLALTKGRFWPVFSVGLLAVASLGAYGWQKIEQWTDYRPFTGLSRIQAQSRAEILCKNLTGAPALAMEASGSSVPTVRGQHPHQEWQVICRAGNDRFFVRVDASRDQLLVFQREERPEIEQKIPNGESESELRNLDIRAASAMGKQYILLSGIATESEAVILETSRWKDVTKTIWEGFYRCRRRNEEKCWARVAVRVRDGALNGLQRMSGAP